MGRPIPKTYKSANTYGQHDVVSIAPRVGNRKNVSDDPSTHLMTYTSADGKYYAYPTLFQNADKSWLELSDKDNWAAFNEAEKRGELFEFDNEQDAANFAKGSWKNKFMHGGELKSKMGMNLRNALKKRYADGGRLGLESVLSSDPIFAQQQQKTQQTGKAITGAVSGVLTAVNPILGAAAAGLGSIITNEFAGSQKKNYVNKILNNTSSATSTYMAEYGASLFQGLGNGEVIKYVGSNHEQGGIKVTESGTPTNTSDIEVEDGETLVKLPNARLIFSKRLAI